MPVTPNLAFFFWRMLDPGKKTLPNRLSSPSVEVQLESAVGKLEQFIYRLMQKCKKWTCEVSAGKRVQRMRCRCVSGGLGRNAGRWVLFSPYFWGALIPFHAHCPLPHPSSEKTQKCKTITPDSAWLLPRHLCHTWEILFWLEHVGINSHSSGPTLCSCQTSSAILHLSLPCVRRAPLELN